MNIIKSLHWPLIIGLGALALVRPGVRIVEHQLEASDPPVVPIIITIVISAIWIAVVGFSRTARPVATLLFTGLSYAVLAIIMSAILSPSSTESSRAPSPTPSPSSRSC